MVLNLSMVRLLKQFLGNKKVEAVQTNKGKFATDMVIMCIGFQANTVLGHTELELFKKLWLSR